MMYACMHVCTCMYMCLAAWESRGGPHGPNYFSRKWSSGFFFRRYNSIILPLHPNYMYLYRYLSGQSVISLEAVSLYNSSMYVVCWGSRCFLLILQEESFYSD
ncbi:hypothetical protein GGR54DRAFT_166179 [Hypoxylon sp. NC1633]|nr:hypothetical protein GGR54DRAFT_166179 [Hypoxylon sp. NC1633]